MCQRTHNDRTTYGKLCGLPLPSLKNLSREYADTNKVKFENTFLFLSPNSVQNPIPSCHRLCTLCILHRYIVVPLSKHLHFLHIYICCFRNHSTVLFHRRYSCLILHICKRLHRVLLQLWDMRHLCKDLFKQFLDKHFFSHLFFYILIP